MSEFKTGPELEVHDSAYYAKKEKVCGLILKSLCKE